STARGVQLVSGPPGSVCRVNTHLALLLPVLTRITTHTPSSPSIFAWDRNVLGRHCRARPRSGRAVNTKSDRGCQQALSYAIQTTFAMLVRLNDMSSFVPPMLCERLTHWMQSGQIVEILPWDRLRSSSSRCRLPRSLRARFR